MAAARSFDAPEPSEMERLYQHGCTLYDLKRYPEAEATFRQVLARASQNAMAHFFLAASLISQYDPEKPEKLKDGVKEARATIAARPDYAGGYLLLGLGHLYSRKYDEALEAVHQAMHISPEEEKAYYVAAAVYRAKSQWEKMLQAAETGLKLAPEDTDLLNQRAEALIMLGRKADAQQAIDLALRSDPTSPKAHTNHGWLELYNGNQREALLHFREAMRLEPDSQLAREGLVTALHARNPLYTLLLKYYLFTRRLSTSEMWAGIAILAGVNRVIRLAVRAFPPLLILALPYFFFYSIFAFFTWTGEAFFDLLLRLSPTGQLVLSKDEKNAAAGCAFLIGLFVINLLAFIAALILHPGEFKYLWTFFLGAALSTGMAIPISSIFKVDATHKNRRAVLVVLAVLLGASALCGWGGSFSLAPWHGVGVFLFIIGFASYPLIANLVFSVKS